jgi:hypothetical protein
VSTLVWFSLSREIFVEFNNGTGTHGFNIQRPSLFFHTVLVLFSAGKFCAISRNHAASSLMIPFANLDREQRVSTLFKSFYKLGPCSHLLLFVAHKT